MVPIEEAKAVLDVYFSAMRSQDWEKMKACFLHDDSLVYVGTDHNEMWQGWNAVEGPLRSQVESFERVVVNRQLLSIEALPGKKGVSFLEEDEMIITSEGKRHDVKVRLTGVVAKVSRKWLIVNLHRSIAPGSQVVRYSHKPSFRI